MIGSSNVMMVTASSPTGNVTEMWTVLMVVTNMTTVTTPPSVTRTPRYPLYPPASRVVSVTTGCSNVPVSSVYHIGGNVMVFLTVMMPVMNMSVVLIIN